MSPGQKTMIENNLGVIRQVVLKFVHHWAAVPDSWQYAVACEAVCEAVAANKWNPRRAKFSTFISAVAYYSIITEWNKQKKRTLPTDPLDKEFDVVIPPDNRVTLDIPYKDVFKNGFAGKLKRDAEMFRRSIEGESITDLAMKFKISRQSFYNRVQAVKDILAKHAVRFDD